MDNNFSAQFGFNGQWRRLGHGKYGSPATEEMNADVVQNTCEPLCEEHFGGVPMQPLYAGKGRVVASYDQVFRGFEDIVSCDGCTETRVPDKV